MKRTQLIETGIVIPNEIGTFSLQGLKLWSGRLFADEVGNWRVDCTVEPVGAKWLLVIDSIYNLHVSHEWYVTLVPNGP